MSVFAISQSEEKYSFQNIPLNMLKAEYQTKFLVMEYKKQYMAKSQLNQNNSKMMIRCYSNSNSKNQMSRFEYRFIADLTFI